MRILKQLKKIFHQGKTIDQQIIQELKTTKEETLKNIINLIKQNNELQNTITNLGTKDKEHIKTLGLLQKDNTTLINVNEELTTKIAIMRKDLQTQTQFMECVNTAIHTMITELTKLPDTMPSQNPNFHTDHQISNVENPHTHQEITKENPKRDEETKDEE